jgi:hypothetical protein
MTDEKKPPKPEPEEEQGSAVARALEIIDAEYRAAQQGLYGLAAGTSQHDFITRRMEGIERMRERVIDLVGDEDEANRMVMEQLERSDKALEPKKPKGETESDKP